MISLLHTTARPGICEATAKIWHDRADDPKNVEHVMTYEHRFFEVCPHSRFRKSLVSFSCGDSVVTGWNLAASLAVKIGRSGVFVCVSDDLYPPEHWDTIFAEAIGDISKEAVLWVGNYCETEKGRLQLHWDLICHPVLTKAYWQRYGYLFHPAYFARFSDMEFTEVALRDGVVIDSRRQISFNHQDHHGPQYVREETSARINDMHEVDEKVFLARKAAGFPREWDEWAA